ncbi:hypothetical protein AVEN_226492-1 [Araneus ventricosus]|uniref:Uncharacterized protein n=1 Tax=Araneus ventricosus TaxID=182803 RepID=A0A4Y2E3C1_ARAVE|nr:hypothetical protein AVEN_226492-1 [Araneus ventricosus]
MAGFIHAVIWAKVGLIQDEAEMKDVFQMARVPPRNTILHWVSVLHTRATLMSKRPSGVIEWYVPLKLCKASDKPCCAVRVNLLGSILLNLASIIVR